MQQGDLPRGCARRRAPRARAWSWRPKAERAKLELVCLAHPALLHRELPHARLELLARYGARRVLELRLYPCERCRTCARSRANAVATATIASVVLVRVVPLKLVGCRRRAVAQHLSDVLE